jgi:hypothetical protein
VPALPTITTRELLGFDLSDEIARLAFPSAQSAALTAAMRIDLGKQIQYDRTFREVYAQQYPVMLIEATERVEREISAAS